MSHINKSYLLIPSQNLLQCFFKWPATQIQGYVFPRHTARYPNLHLKLPAFSGSKILPGMEVLGREERLWEAGLQPSPPQHPSRPHFWLFNHENYATLILIMKKPQTTAISATKLVLQSRHMSLRKWCVNILYRNEEVYVKRKNFLKDFLNIALFFLCHILLTVLVIHCLTLPVLKGCLTLSSFWK